MTEAAAPEWLPEAEAIAKLQLLLQQIGEGDQVVDSLSTRKLKLERKRDLYLSELGGLLAEERHDAAMRELDGADAVAPRPARIKRIAVLEKTEIPQIEAAIDTIAPRQAAARLAQSKVKMRLAGDVLELTCPMQQNALEQIREGLRSVKIGLSQLTAAEYINGRLLGESFPVPQSGKYQIISGRVITSRFTSTAEKLPSGVCPAEFTQRSIEASARKAANGILKQIKGS